MLYKCIGCSADKPESEYYINAGYRVKRCKVCERKRALKRLEDPDVRCRKQAREKEYRALHRKRALEILGNKCNRCGNSDSRCFQIHHVGHNGHDSEERMLARAPNKFVKALQKRREEFELLCANCHCIHHAEHGTDERPITPTPTSPY